MSQETNFWLSPFGKLLRWTSLVLFIPLLFILCIAYKTHIHSILFSYIACAIISRELGVLSYRIAPSKKLSIKVFGTIVALLTFLTAYGTQKGDEEIMWLLILTGAFYFIGMWMKHNGLKLDSVFKL